MFADKVRGAPAANGIPWNSTETWSRRDWIKLTPANWLPSRRHFDGIKRMLSNWWFHSLLFLGLETWRGEWASHFVGGTAVEHSRSSKLPLLLVSTLQDVSSSLTWGPQEGYHLPAVAYACPTTAPSLQVAAALLDDAQAHMPMGGLLWPP